MKASWLAVGLCVALVAAGGWQAAAPRTAGTPAATAKPMTLVINLTSGLEDIHAVTMGLQLANHGLEDKAEVLVFLNVRAALLASDKWPAQLAMGKNPPAQQMLAKLIERGATVIVCPACMEVMGVQPADVIADVQLADREKLFGRLGPNAHVFTY